MPIKCYYRQAATHYTLISAKQHTPSNTPLLMINA